MKWYAFVSLLDPQAVSMAFTDLKTALQISYANPNSQWLELDPVTNLWKEAVIPNVGQ